MIRKIVPANNPVLRKKSKPVKKIDKKTKNLIKDLKETLVSQKDPEGVGLAAPQIGKNVRIFVMRHKKDVLVVINPEIIKIGKIKKTPKQKKVLEGCLSILNYYGPLSRPQKITIKFLNEKGEKVKKEFTGFPAQIVQHEIDHLNGVLFVDKLLKEKKPLYRQLENGEWEKVDIENI